MSPYERAAQRHTDEARQRVAEKEADPRRDESFLGRRHRRLEVAIGGAGEVGVALAQEEAEPREGTGLGEGLTLSFEAVAALDVRTHRGALQARQAIGVLPQLVDRAVPLLPGRARVLVEARHDAIELVDRSAEALAVLLSELRRL